MKNWIISASACLAIFCGCGGPAAESDDRPTIGVRKDPGFQHQGFQHQGFQHQGFQHQGTGLAPVLGFRLSSLARNARPLGGSVHDQAELNNGSVQLYWSHATPSTSTTSCSGTTYGRYRNCGWENAGFGQCTPSSWVSLNPGGVCGGSCVGDPMIRVCSGTATCDYGSTSLIASSDDACGTLCPSVGFICPSSGKFTVMTASYASSAYSKVEPYSWEAWYPALAMIEGTSLNGLIIDADLSAGGTTAVRITDVQPELPAYVTPAGDTFRYLLEVQDPATGGWEPLCGPDHDGFPGAIAVQGYWDASGGHIYDPDLITFACRDGVVNKCYRWGYQPWKYATRSDGTWTSLWDHHQACTRMARADYCGDGRSWTHDGTLINMWDLQLSPSIQLEDTSAYLPFEAAWDPGGAACVSHKRYAEAPDMVLNCPRINTPNGTLFCDNMNDVYGFYPAALFANRSNENYVEPR